MNAPRRGGKPSAGRPGAPKSGAKSGARFGGQSGAKSGAKSGGQRSGQNRAGQNRSGQNRAGQGRTGANRSDARDSGAPPRRSAEPRGQRSALPLDGEQVEGRRAVRELLVAGRRRVRSVHVAIDLEPSDILDEICDLAGPVLRKVTSERVADIARTESHQGVVAFAEPVQNVELVRLVQSADVPFLVALDGVTDPGNLGAILRTAETAGVTGVVLPRKRSVHVSPTVAKAAAGAIEHVPIALCSGIPGAIDRVKRERVWVVGLDGDADQTLDDLQIASEPIMLVLGAEGRGLAPLTKRRCDLLVRIPMYGDLESMNVSAAAAVAMHAVARLRDPDRA